MVVKAAIEPEKFGLGQFVATPGALDALEESGERFDTYVYRHVTGDWGDVDQEDARANDRALGDESRIFSVYHLEDESRTKIWIITEAVGPAGRRESTCILLPEDY